MPPDSRTRTQRSRGADHAWLLGSLGTVGPTAAATGGKLAPPSRPPCFEIAVGGDFATIDRHLLAAVAASRERLNHGPEHASDAPSRARIVPLQRGVSAGYSDRCGF